MSRSPPQTAPTTASPADFDAAFDRAFVLVSYVMNRFLVDHMLRVARELTDGDFVSMVVLAVLAHQNVAHLLPPGSSPSRVLDTRGRVPPRVGLRPLRLRDVVQITGIPRETVRRKLERLAAGRWIERQDEGWVVSRARAEPEMREISRESVRRFLAAADEMARALWQAEEAIAADRPARP